MIMNPVIIRVGITAAVILLYVISVVLYKYINRRQIQYNFKQVQLPIDIKQELPTLLYFWAPNCVQCNSQELYLDAAVSKLQKRGKEFNIRKINAHLDSKIASQFRIVTVPTIVVVDPHGKIKSWNPGLMHPKKIVSQLSFSPN
jgi:thiol-disulfide isomerase/thioredoxin